MAAWAVTRPEVVTELYRRGSKYLLLAGLPIGAFALLESDRFVAMLFGSDYAPSADAARLLLPAATFMFLSNFGETALACVNRWGTIVVVSTLALVVNVALEPRADSAPRVRGRGLGHAGHGGAVFPRPEPWPCAVRLSRGLGWGSRGVPSSPPPRSRSSCGWRGRGRWWRRPSSRARRTRRRRWCWVWDEREKELVWALLTSHAVGAVSRREVVVRSAVSFCRLDGSSGPLPARSKRTPARPQVPGHRLTRSESEAHHRHERVVVRKSRPGSNTSSRVSSTCQLRPLSPPRRSAR